MTLTLCAGVGRMLHAIGRACCRCGAEGGDDDADGDGGPGFAELAVIDTVLDGPDTWTPHTDLSSAATWRGWRRCLGALGLRSHKDELAEAPSAVEVGAGGLRTLSEARGTEIGTASAVLDAKMMHALADVGDTAAGSAPDGASRAPCDARAAGAKTTGTAVNGRPPAEGTAEAARQSVHVDIAGYLAYLEDPKPPRPKPPATMTFSIIE